MLSYFLMTMSNMFYNISNFKIAFQETYDTLIVKPRVFYLGPGATLSEVNPLRNIVRLRKFNEIVQSTFQNDPYWTYLNFDRLTIALVEVY